MHWDQVAVEPHSDPDLWAGPQKQTAKVGQAVGWDARCSSAELWPVENDARVYTKEVTKV